MTTAQTERKIAAHTHLTFNGQDNGGESIGFSLYIYDDKSITQSLDLQSYCNSSHIELRGNLITADKLREAANIMDRTWALLQSRSHTEKFTPETVIECSKICLADMPEATPLILETDYIDNGDSKHGLPVGIYTNQRLGFDVGQFKSYIYFCGASIDADVLRKWANQLDRFFASNTLETDASQLSSSKIIQ